MKKQISPETILARVQDYIGAIKSQPNHVHLSFKVIKVDRVFSIFGSLALYDENILKDRNYSFHKITWIRDITKRLVGIMLTFSRFLLK